MSAHIVDKAFTPYRYSLGLSRPYNLILWLSLAAAAGLSLLDVFGWIFHITSFKSISPEWETMKIVTAICLLLSAISIAVIILNRSVFPVRFTVQLVAGFICLIGALTVYCYVFHFINDRESSITNMNLLAWAIAPMSRMALLTAFNFFLTGSTIFLLSSEKKNASAIAHGVIIPVILVSYFTVISYILGVKSATKFDDVAIALNTGIAFCLLSITVLMMDRKTWLLKVFTSNDSGGIFARKFFPYILVLPVVIGWLRIKGEIMEIFSSDRGVVYVAVTYSLILAVIVWITARSVNSIDRKKNILARELQESEERFKVLAEATPVGMGVVGFPNSEFLYVNPAYEQHFGYERDELLGKKSPEIYCDLKDRDLIYKKLQEDNFIDDFEVKLKRKDGSSFWSMSTVKPIIFNNQKAFLGTFIDITVKKDAEDALRNSEQRLKYHLENSPLAIVEWDKDFRILQWSTEAERIFGLKKENVLGIRIDRLDIIYHEDLPLVQKTIARLISGKELKVISQNRNYTKTGEIIECIWYNSVLLDENGEMSSVMSLIEDVTILKRTENQLLESRESYKELVTNARSIIIKLDNEGKFTFINEFATNFFGYRKEELLGKSVMKTIVPEKDSKGRALNKMVENIIEDPDKYSININENIKKSGEKAWIEWHNKALYDHSGNRTGQISIGVDITKRKKAEEAHKESEGKLRSVLDATQESIYMFDRAGTICMSNSTGISRLKKTSENEIVGHHFSEFVNRDIAKRRMVMLDEVFTKARPIDFEDERDCRIYHHNFFPVFKDEQVLFVVSYSSDITDRKRAESKLLESEDRFRTIAESLTVMISITRICDLTLAFVNEPFESTFGFKKAELIDKKAPDIFYFSHDYENVNDALTKKGIVDNMEIKVKRRDGSPFWIMTSIRTINFMGEPSYLSAAIDITETKKAQEELLRLNRTLNAHSKSSQAMMHSTNEFNYLNAVCKIIIEDCGHSMVWVGYAETDKRRSVKPVAFFGFDKGYIDQMNITWDDSDRGRGPTGTAIRTGKPSMCKNMLTDPEFKPWRKAALERGYASSLVLPLMSEGKPFGAISIYSKEPDSFSEPEINLLSDLADDLAYGISFLRLTEAERTAARAVKESEAKLKEMVVTKDKFFNIVAHDLKNPFTSLLGSSELLYDNINQMSSENIRKLALILNDSAKGGYAILQNLLDWSRSQTGLLKFNPEKINLKIVIDENIDNLQLQVKNKDISLKSELAEDFFIHADKNMINTVLRNLLSNAVKYTFKNGIIVVTVTQKPEEVIITVKDSGMGISDDKAGALFKLENSLSLPGTEKEQGTGLGLKLCKEFTERMGGRIWVESTLGKGSKFKFTIPVKA